VAFQTIADIAWTKAKQRLQYKVNDARVAALGARVRVQTVVSLLANVSTSAQLVTKSKLDALIETLLRRFVQEHKQGYRGRLIAMSTIKRDAVRIRRMLYDNAAPIPDASAATTTTTATTATSSASAVKVKVKKPARKRLKRDEDDDEEEEEDDIDDVDEEDLDEDEEEEAEDEDEDENDDVDDGDLDDVEEDVQHEEEEDDDDVAEDEADHDDEEQQRRTIHVITDEKRTEFEK